MVATVVGRWNNKKYYVYDVEVDEDGKPMFLVSLDDRFEYVDANEFREPGMGTHYPTSEDSDNRKSRREDK